MNPIRRLAVYMTMILILNCIIQGEFYWIEQKLSEQPLPEKNEENVFFEYQQAVENVWEELVYFPVPASTSNPSAKVSFVNTWLDERTYGGTRWHEGTDLMASIDKAGYYPVVSMTDGVVERVGWLQKGGWRIGVRSDGGNYYYYAHLHSYAKEWKGGETVKAGELLGFMGDSGYGEEGTVGQFPVHLHLGIYLPLGADRELALNPYWMLRMLEGEKLEYSY